MKKTIVILILSCTFFFCCTSSFSQGVDYKSYISYEKAAEDLDYYLSHLESQHIDLYWHTPKSIVQAYFNECKKQLPKDSVQVVDIAIMLSNSNHFWDYHTSVTRVTKVMPNKFFPDTYCRNGKIYLRGTNLRIDSVNQFAVQDIINQWKLQAGCDRTDSYYSTVAPLTFSHFRGAISDLKITSPYRIKTTNEHGKDSALIINGIEEKTILAKRNPLYTDTLYSFELYPHEKIGIIRYNKVFYKQNHPKAQTDFFYFFEKCQKNRIQYLFIDISHNHGGVAKDYDIFFPYLKMNDNIYYQEYRERPRGGQPIKDTNERFSREEYRKTRKGIHLFGGQIFIYQSSISLSAASDFSAVMKVLTNALLVGTEVGDGIPNYTHTIQYRLPNTKIVYSISQRLYTSETPQLSRDTLGCLLPDIPYPFDIEHKLDINDCKNIIKLYKQR